MVVDIRKLFVDSAGGIAPPGDTPHTDVPVFGCDREARGKLRPLSVDRDAPHDRDVSIPERRVFLDPKSITIKFNSSIFITEILNISQ